MGEPIEPKILKKVDQNEPFMDEPIKNYKIFFMNSAILKIHLISMVKIKK
jgi:hypothetical protein